MLEFFVHPIDRPKAVCLAFLIIASVACAGAPPQGADASANSPEVNETPDRAMLFEAGVSEADGSDTDVRIGSCSSLPWTRGGAPTTPSCEKEAQMTFFRILAICHCTYRPRSCEGGVRATFDPSGYLVELTPIGYFHCIHPDGPPTEYCAPDLSYFQCVKDAVASRPWVLRRSVVDARRVELAPGA